MTLAAVVVVDMYAVVGVCQVQSDAAVVMVD